jgi:hypothetical protein
VINCKNDLLVGNKNALDVVFTTDIFVYNSK